MLSTMNLQECYRNRRRGRMGFTLAEILIALGILAIGMSMVAAIFPAAMALNRVSANSTLGTIICENGIAMGEMELTADIVEKSDNLEIYADDKHLTYLTRVEQHYPIEEADSRTGFVLMARKVKDATGVYQLIAIAYRKREATNTVELVETSCSVNGKRISGASKLRIGSPLINRSTGKFAYIDSINQTGTAGTLDIPDGQESQRGMTGGSCYVLVEKRGATTIDRRSPAIGVMSKMTGLKRDPGHFGE